MDLEGILNRLLENCCLRQTCFPLCEMVLEESMMGEGRAQPPSQECRRPFYLVCWSP